MYMYLILVYHFVICVILNYHVPLSLFIFISFFCPSSMAASLPFPTVSLSFSSFSYIQSSSSATGQYICIFINVVHVQHCVMPMYKNMHVCFKFVHFYYYFIFYYFCVVSYAVHSSLMLTWVLVLLLLSISYSSSYNLLFSLNSVTPTQ